MSRSFEALLARAGWQDAQRAWLVADASFRRYCRLTLNGATRLLMDAPPDREDVRAYMAIAQHLRARGLSAPEVFAADPAQGYLLIEDFGPRTYNRALAERPGDALGLYTRAVDVLAVLHQAPAPDQLLLPNGTTWPLPRYDPDLIADHVSLFGQWYLPAIGRDPQAAAAIEAAVTAQAPVPARPVLCLRDYHIDNLMVLPNRSEVAAVGLLDFQDAVAGHPAYDLMSLVEDARHDVAEADRLIRHYLTRTGQAEEPFRRAFARWGMVRHLRILGTFARLWRRDGKDRYLQHIPRVWRHLDRAVEAAGETALQKALAQLVPAEQRRLPLTPPPSEL
ncbi:MAG: aminoglycoside phosphotransferase family protein [Rhodothalassiaceae bacterium]